MSEGRIVYETPAAGADRKTIGAHMGGGDRPRTMRRRRPSPKPHDDATASPRRPSPTRSTPAETALVVIDMQRDFIEPGGFGDTLGNDVGLLRRRSCRPRAAARGLARSAAGRSSTRARRTARPLRLPAGQARCAATPSLRIGDAGPMGRILIAGEPGNQIIAGAGAASPARSSSTSPARARSTPPACTRCCRRAASRHLRLHRRDHRGLRADHRCARPTTAATTACCSRTAPRATFPSSRRRRSR